MSPVDLFERNFGVDARRVLQIPASVGKDLRNLAFALQPRHAAGYLLVRTGAP